MLLIIPLYKFPHYGRCNMCALWFQDQTHCLNILLHSSFNILFIAISHVPELIILTFSRYSSVFYCGKLTDSFHKGVFKNREQKSRKLGKDKGKEITCSNRSREVFMKHCDWTKAAVGYISLKICHESKTTSPHPILKD